MKIALTADVHLTTRAKNPERYNALENICEQSVARNVEHLIIAGDLFDQETGNYSEFESLCGAYSKLQFHIIPGNHDPGISSKNVTGKNIHVYTRPTLQEIDSVRFLLMPYEEGKSMGEGIASVRNMIGGEPWILVGHGDFYGGVTHPNPLEPGTYMPLSKNDLERLEPQTVFLGHVHVPHDPVSNVHYVGSPSGLDITETGRRFFLCYDTSNGTSERVGVETDVLYFQETFFVIPSENELETLKGQITSRIDGWDIEAADYPKVQIRVGVQGYTKDRTALLQTLEEGFSDFSYYEDQGPDMDALSFSDDDQLDVIANRTLELIEEIDWAWGDSREPEKEQVKLAALSVIYQD